MPSAPGENAAAAVKRAVNIVDLIGEKVSLSRRGRTFKGLCPFHDDHNPSLDVDPERQAYRCWSCGAKGDVFDFVMNQERVGFREALELLAHRARIELPKQLGGDSGTRREPLLKVLKWAEDEFHRCFQESAFAQPARAYVSNRGLNEKSIQTFRIGFAPDQWDWLIQRARSQRVTPETLEKCGLAKVADRGSGYLDKFRGRLMFPIRDARGRTIAFGGRILPQFETPHTPKYLNSPETRVFTKSEHLYGLDQARDAIVKAKAAVVMEGYTDCIMAHQHGLCHAVSTLGTALGSSHIAMLKRYAERTILVYDGDRSGQDAADRALGLFLSNEVDLRLLTIPDNLDPCDFLLHRGAEAFRGGLDSAVDALDFKLQRASHLYDSSTMSGRRQALDFVLNAIAALPLLTTGTAAVTREIVLDRLGQRLGLPAETVRKRLREMRERTRGHKPATNSPPPQGLSAHESPVERELLEVLLAEPARIKTALEEITLEQIKTPGFRRILEVCIETIRDGEAVDLDSLRLRLEDRELACRASILAETGREKGALDRRLADVVAYFKSRKPDADERLQDGGGVGQVETGNDCWPRRYRIRTALSRQSKAQRHA